MIKNLLYYLPQHKILVIFSVTMLDRCLQLKFGGFFNMGVMQKLRDNTHIILWATLILFVLGMTIGGLIRGANLVDIFTGERKNRNLAGSVNDQKLKSRQFMNMVQNQISQMRENGQTINNRMYSTVSDRVWNQYVNEVLLGEVIEKYNLETSGEEIYNYLRTSPPQFLRN